MKRMKTFASILAVMIIALVAVSSCSKKEDPRIAYCFEVKVTGGNIAQMPAELTQKMSEIVTKLNTIQGQLKLYGKDNAETQQKFMTSYLGLAKIVLQQDSFATYVTALHLYGVVVTVYLKNAEDGTDRLHYEYAF